MSPLAQGNLPPAPLQAQIRPGPLPTSCVTSFEDLAKWLSTFGVEFTQQQVAFAYSAGPVNQATPEQRTFPRFIFNDIGLFMGIGVYDSTLGSWTTGGVLGELKTVVRSSGSMAEELVAKGFQGSGWHLADGTTSGIPDLTGNDGFFTGTGPNWTIYTVGYTGT